MLYIRNGLGFVFEKRGPMHSALRSRGIRSQVQLHETATLVIRVLEISYLDRSSLGSNLEIVSRVSHATNLVPVPSCVHPRQRDRATDCWNRVGQKLRCSAHFRFDSFIFARLHARRCKPVLSSLSSREWGTGPPCVPPPVKPPRFF